MKAPKSQRRPVALIAGLAGLAIAVSANAADWEFNPTIEGGFVYDDNFFLAPDGNEIDVQGALLDARLEIRARLPAGEFSFLPRVRSTYFPDTSEANTTDFFGAFNWQHHGQRLETEIDADISQQDVVNAELPDAEIAPGSDLGEGIVGDGGRIFESNRRTRGYLNPQLSYELSARKRLLLEAEITNVTFEDEFAGSQVGYDVQTLAAGFQTALTPLSSLSFRGRGSQIDLKGLEPSMSYGLEAEWNSRTAAETRSFVRLGAQNTEVPNGDAVTSWLAGAGVAFVFGRNEVFTDIARSVGPSSLGAIITRDQLRLRFARALTPRMQLQLGLRGTHDDAIDEQIAFSERTYAVADVGFQWRMHEELSLRAGIDYAMQEFSDTDLDASSSGASLTLLYQPTTRR
jgi:hypothetical protein